MYGLMNLIFIENGMSEILGQKLSKEVLQRSNNMKKLRAREKEMSEDNEKQK